MISITGRLFYILFWTLLGSASAIKAESAFERWVSSFQSEARNAGLSNKTLREAFHNLTPDLDVLKAANNQAEFVRPIWDYLDSAVSGWRVREGQNALRHVSEDIAEIERRWGVESSVLIAIWGLESSYGGILGDDKIVKNVVRSLATLAYADLNRQRFWKKQLLAALKILQQGDVAANQMTGSWAGAMGHTQFIPTTYLAHAVDYDGDGRRDIWQNELDALASAANYLAENGWIKDRSWGFEVILPDGFDYALADQKTEKSVKEWEEIGVKAVAGRYHHRHDLAKLFLPAGARGPAFLLLENFDVIKRYNNANAYALAIGHLADRIMGAAPLKTSWPRDLAPLDRKDRKQLQKLLTVNGFDTKGVDGIIGPNSQAAIRAFQSSLGLTPDGFPTKNLLIRLLKNEP